MARISVFDCSWSVSCGGKWGGAQLVGSCSRRPRHTSDNNYRRQRIVTIRNTILEGKAKELELKEKALALSKIESKQGLSSKTISTFVEPVIGAQKTQYLLLRFVVIFLMLAFFEALRLLLGAATAGAALSVQYFSPETNVLSKVWIVWLIVMEQILQFAPMAIVLVFGWPLFRDIQKLMNFSLWHGRSSATPSSS